MQSYFMDQKWQLPEWARSERYDCCEGFLETYYGTRTKKDRKKQLRTIYAKLSSAMAAFFL